MCRSTRQSTFRSTSSSIASNQRRSTVHLGMSSTASCGRWVLAIRSIAQDCCSNNANSGIEELRLMRSIAIALVAVAWLAPLQIHAASSLLLEEQPRFGVYYHRYEPVFYTGFAPRTNDPLRIHLHLGRGNQLRLTVV